MCSRSFGVMMDGGQRVVAGPQILLYGGGVGWWLVSGKLVSSILRPCMSTMHQRVPMVGLGLRWA